MSIEVIEVESSGLSGIETVEVRQGPAGEAGLSVSTSIWEYKAKTSATSGYPGDGKILWNNATQTSATSLLFSHLTDNSSDIELILGFIEVGQQIFIQDQDESANFQIWDVTGTPTVTGANTTTAYYTFPVTLSSSGGTGTTGFANNHSILAGLACAVVTAAAIRAAVPNMVEVASPVNDDMIQRVGGSWVTRTIAQVRTALGLGSAAYTASTAYATAAQGTTANAALPRSGGVMTGYIGMGGNSLYDLNDLTPTSGTASYLPAVGGTLAKTSDITGTNSGTNTGDETGARIAALITAASGKTTPVDADELPIADSAASFGLKKVTFANLWAWVKAKIESVTLSTISVRGNATFDTNTLFVDAVNNRVGVGTVSPQGSLHIIGASSNDQLRLERTGSAAGYGTLYSNANEALGFIDQAGNYQFVVRQTTGNMGVGTFTPANKLGVMGAASVGITYSDIAAPTSGMIIEGNVGIGNTSPSEKLDVTGNIKLSGNIELGHASDTTLSRSAAGKLAVEGVDVVSTAGTQTIAGAKTFSGQTELTGQAATNSTSAMTRALTDTRAGRIFYLIESGLTSSNSTSVVLSATSVVLPAGTYCYKCSSLTETVSTTAGMSSYISGLTASARLHKNIIYAAQDKFGTGVAFRRGNCRDDFDGTFGQAFEDASATLLSLYMSGDGYFTIASDMTLQYAVSQRTTTDAANPAYIRSAIAEFTKIY